MSNSANITIPVDETNPGQFFACCGLLEVADRLWPGAEGWFEPGTLRSNFQIAASPAANLSDILVTAKRLHFDLGEGERKTDDDGEEEDTKTVKPIIIQSPVALVLDWWSDKSIKPWAGSMKERLILRAMLLAIEPSESDPLNAPKTVFDPPTASKQGKRNEAPAKREPFYFDCRRGCNAHPLDSGFSPDTQNLKSECFPAVEAMCFIGLQRARPAPTDEPNRSRYTVWTKPLPVNAIAPVVCGFTPVHGSLAFAFHNFFRTDQRKHKCFSRATQRKE
ncbi:putative CRISPR-associated protein [Candidatus Sulfopaludibacter sp. SbA6]|nr:putative CRISPR-associated protein [Candidatus Sulfopaludibacter sp. SbA6]